MAVYTRRIQTVSTEAQYAELARLAHDSGKPISLLVREAIEKLYLEQAQRARRRTALARILALQAPVADWEQMEAEIIQGAIE